MRICLCTLYDQAIASYARIGEANKRAYCERHGYAFACDHDLTDPHRPAPWSKIPMLVREARGGYDWLFWSDADSLIMNPEITLESIITRSHPAQLIFTTDQDGLNSGNFFVKNTPEAIAFLSDVYRSSDGFNPPFYEEQIIKQKVNGSPHPLVRCAPQDEFNSYPGTYRDGNFLIHFAGRPDKQWLMEKFSTQAEEHLVVR